MREILFRGKRVDNLKWATGALFVYHVDNSYRIIPVTEQELMAGEAYEVIPSTVGQYTGMKDCNGAKIFEGDMLKCANVGDKIMYRVVWDRHTAGWSVIWNAGQSNIGGVDTIDNWDPEDWEVVTE